MNNNKNHKRTISSPDITTKNSGNTANASAAVESVVTLKNSKRMKAIDGEIEIESKKKFETLGERSEIAGIETPVVVEKVPVKKKTRVVKKIVKKMVIKKVPKRLIVASPNCNDNAVMEIEKPNVVAVVDEFEVSDRGKDVDLVENSGSCSNGSERSAVVMPLLSSDHDFIQLQDVDHNRVESQDNDQNGIKLQNSDWKLIELQNVVQNQNRDEMLNSDQNRIELQDSDQNQIELQYSDQNRVEMPDNDQNGIELQDMEHDIKTMDLEESEGEEEVKELVVNNETNGLELQEDLSESRVTSGEMVTTGLRMKHRTKIIIHGLDEKIKEEDIRKVFEKIGEVVEVKLIINFNTGKSRGFGFIRYASADLANMALTKFHNVEICGRPCITAAIEGTDAILLNNIDKKWNNEYVVTLLQKIGIKKIDEVWVVPDSENTELNLGFAFVEFETKRDAQIAFNKLQNKYVFGKDSKIKAAWAEPLADPVKAEMHNQVKSVYAEHIPSSWGENEVKDYFIIFGAIESIALAKNLRSTHRNDFAFINFKTCDAARSCVEALSCKNSTNKNGLEGQLKVSLAKSIPKGKPMNIIPQSTVTEVPKVYKKVNQSIPFQSHYQKASQLRPFQENPSVLGVYKPQIPTNMKFASIGRHEDCKKDVGSSTTEELVRLLREQASWKHGGSSSSAGVSIGHHQVPSGGKQSFTELAMGSNSLYHDRRPYPQTHFQIPYPAPPRPLASSFPHYDQQRAHYTSGPFDVAKPNPRHFQIRDQATYPGSSSIYRQMH